MFATRNRCVVGVLLLLLCMPYAHAAGGSQVSGQYRIVDAVSQRHLVQVTVQVLLINHSDSEISLQNPALRYGSSRLQPTLKPDAIVLPPRGTAVFVRKITVRAQAYEAWTHMAPLALSFNSRASAGEPTGRAILLRAAHPARHLQAQPQPRPTGGLRP